MNSESKPPISQVLGMMRKMMGSVPAAIEKAAQADDDLVYEHLRSRGYAVPAEKPYFCFAPPALGPFSIEIGKPYRSRYRFYVHAGRPDPSTLDRVWSDFAHPAQSRIVKEVYGAG